MELSGVYAHLMFQQTCSDIKGDISMKKKKILSLSVYAYIYFIS